MTSGSVQSKMNLELMRRITLGPLLKRMSRISSTRDGYSESNHQAKIKARLCARGFSQRVGIDYGETFAPVVRYDSLRAFLAIVASEDLEMMQFDIKMAFSNGNLEEDIYLLIPEGVKINKDKNSHYVEN